jgi:hypothetical protein
VFSNGISVDSMATKEAKKWMKTEQYKKLKLEATLQTPQKQTVSRQAPSSDRKCSMKIRIFIGLDNHSYLSKNSCLHLCHHPCLKSYAIFHGHKDMNKCDIDLLTLLFSVSISPIQISQIMEQLKGSWAGKFTPKPTYIQHESENCGATKVCSWIVAQ